MASETSGDCVGACEHPTRIPTTSSASEAKHTGKVLILDLLITITHQAVVIECTLYCRTLLPNYSQSTSGRTGHRSSLGMEVRRLRLSLPTASIQRLHYSEAQARRATGRPVCTGSGSKRSVLRTEPTVSSRVSHWDHFGSAL